MCAHEVSFERLAAARWSMTVCGKNGGKVPPFFFLGVLRQSLTMCPCLAWNLKITTVCLLSAGLNGMYTHAWQEKVS